MTLHRFKLLVNCCLPNEDLALDQLLLLRKALRSLQFRKDSFPLASTDFQKVIGREFENIKKRLSINDFP